MKFISTRNLTILLKLTLINKVKKSIHEINLYDLNFNDY